MTNVFDLMVPSATSAPSEDKFLQENRELVTPFVDLLTLHAQDGELFGLVEKFEKYKLTDKLQSWIGRGNNESLSTDEVKCVLGDEFLKSLAERLPTASASEPEPLDEKLLMQVSEVFPVVVRRFTRSGQIPPQRILLKSAIDFRKSLEKKA